MPNRLLLSALGVIGAAAAAVAWYLNPPTTLMDYLRVISAAPTAIAIAFGAFEWGLWRFLPAFVIAPKKDLNGTWKVQAENESLDGKHKDQFQGYMFVRQSYLTLSMRLETPTTTSELEVDEFVRKKGGTIQLWAIYDCSARGDKSQESIKRHYGAMILDCNPTELNGRFWVNQVLKNEQGHEFITGTLKLSERRDTVFHSYEEADAAYASKAVTA
jgi:SMODS-associating 2TM, beta-strand rich effector domain